MPRRRVRVAVDAVVGYLHGQVALVTGGTRGVGRATARRLCDAGCHVYLNYAHNDDDARRAAAVLADLPGGITLVKGDVAGAEGLPAILDRIEAGHGRLDVFVHNVASLHPMQASAPYAAGLYADLATALDPLLHGIERLIKLMPADGGRVIAVSSAKLDTGGDPAPRDRELAARSPSGRLASYDDVADVIALLCRDEARFIRGQVITVDGGLSLRAP